MRSYYYRIQDTESGNWRLYPYYSIEDAKKEIASFKPANNEDETYKAEYWDIIRVYDDKEVLEEEYVVRAGIDVEK